MEKYTIDTSYFDIESKQMCGDMCFWYETTLNDEIFADSADEMQSLFKSAFDNGEMQEFLDDTNPQVYNVCRVRYDDQDYIPVGVDLPVITNIVMPKHDDELEKVVLQQVRKHHPCDDIRWHYIEDIK